MTRSSSKKPVKTDWSHKRKVPLSIIPKARFSFHPRGPFEEHLFEARWMPQNDPKFDICVTDEARPRAVAFFERLVEELRRHDVHVMVEKEFHDIKTFARGPTARVSFRIRERLRMQRLLPDKRDIFPKKIAYVPAGRLVFSVHRGSSQTPEFEIADIDGKRTAKNGVEKAVHGILEALREYTEWEAERARREVAAAAAHERREKERHRRSDLLAQAQAWWLPRMVKEYLDALERHAAEKGENSEEFRGWLDWARSVAGTLNPDDRDAPMRFSPPTTFKASDFWAGFWTGRR